MITNGKREAVLKALQHLEEAHDVLGAVPESYKRENAYQLIEDAHQAVALLLMMK